MTETRKPNLPSLPDGYFWRVSKFGIDNPSPRLLLMKKRPLWFPTVIESMMLLDSEHESVALEIEELAEMILNKLDRQKKQRNAVWSVMGDY